MVSSKSLFDREVSGGHGTSRFLTNWSPGFQNLINLNIHCFVIRLHFDLMHKQIWKKHNRYYPLFKTIHICMKLILPLLQIQNCKTEKSCRSGNRGQFESMVQRCNAAGVMSVTSLSLDQLITVDSFLIIILLCKLFLLPTTDVSSSSPPSLPSSSV